MEGILRKELEPNGNLMSRAGKSAAISVREGATANTGPGIMATQGAGHTGVSPCRMLA